jgi:hypothetical protein
LIYRYVIHELTFGLEAWRLVGLQSPSPGLRPPSPPGEGIIKKHPSPGGEGAPEGRMRGHLPKQPLPQPIRCPKHITLIFHQIFIFSKIFFFII